MGDVSARFGTVCHEILFFRFFSEPKMKVGDAKISEKHCNFFVNTGNAKSKDLEKLIYQVQNKVLNKTGINLELELQIIGEKL